MATTFDKLASLREVLFSLEQDLGLAGLDRKQVDIVYAVSRLSEEGLEPIPSEHIREHPLVAYMSQATYNRALKALVTKGYLSHAPHTRGGKYIPGRKMLAH